MQHRKSNKQKCFSINTNIFWSIDIKIQMTTGQKVLKRSFCWKILGRHWVLGKRKTLGIRDKCHYWIRIKKRQWLLMIVRFICWEITMTLARAGAKSGWKTKEAVRFTTFTLICWDQSREKQTTCRRLEHHRPENQKSIFWENIFPWVLKYFSGAQDTSRNEEEGDI